MGQFEFAMQDAYEEIRHHWTKSEELTLLCSYEQNKNTRKSYSRY